VEKRLRLLTAGTLASILGVWYLFSSSQQRIQTFHPSFAQRIESEDSSFLLKLIDSIDSVAKNNLSDKLNALGEPDEKYASLGYSNSIGPKRIVLGFENNLSNISVYLGPTKERVRIDIFTPLMKKYISTHIGTIDVAPLSPPTTHNFTYSGSSEIIYLDNLGPGTALIDAIRNY
jgi:hypothetical protein